MKYILETERLRLREFIFDDIRASIDFQNKYCVMPNIEILSKYTHSELLQAIRASNDMKLEREARLVPSSEGRAVVETAGAPQPAAG